MKMQEQVSYLAEKLDAVAYDGDFSELLDLFEGVPDIEWRENGAGEYESADVWLTFGPTIHFDTANGEIWCSFYADYGSAFVTPHTRKVVDDFCHSLHDC